MTAHLDDDLAQRWVDGALGGRDREACRAHLAACDGCRLVVESYRALAAALEGLAAPAPGPAFTRDVIARIDARERHLALERRAAIAIAGAAVLVLAGALAAAGASAWAPVLAAWSAGLADLVRAASLGVDVAAPLVRVLRVQILLACVAVALPLLLALRRLTLSEAASPTR
jgi:anti-sigma factor RsiW